MGVDSKFYTVKQPTIEKVERIIKDNFKYIHTIECDRHSGDSWYRIQFSHKGTIRDLSYFPNSIDKQTWGTDCEMSHDPYGYMSLGMWGDSGEVLTIIGRNIGGWLDVNDCDDELDVYIDDIKFTRDLKLKSILT